MIDTSGRVSWAKWIPGVPNKVYSEPNSMIGIAQHSVVGQEGAQDDGVPNRFLSTDMVNGRYTDNAAASCTFILRKNGQLIQMYSVRASTWTSGGREANTQYVPIELEGGYSPHNEPMTPEQVASYVRLVRDLEEFSHIKYVPGVNILQHKDLAKMFGYAATACASDRYVLGDAALMAASKPEPPIGDWERRIAKLEQQVTRLNDMVVLRGKFHRLADDPDVSRVERAAMALKAEGIELR